MESEQLVLKEMYVSDVDENYYKYLDCQALTRLRCMLIAEETPL